MIACEFCDLMHHPPQLTPGEKAQCSRCSGLIAKSSRNPVEGVLALALYRTRAITSGSTVS